MKIKFSKDVELLNANLANSIGTGSEITEEHFLPKDEYGEIKYNEGSVPIGIRKGLKVKLEAGTEIEIFSNYKYNKNENSLKFRSKQPLGDEYNFMFSGIIDGTIYEADNINDGDFEIIGK